MTRRCGVWLIAALFVLMTIGIAPPVLAQTDPCAGTPVNAEVKDNESFGIGFCLPLKDSKGIDVTPSTMTVLVDGQQKYSGPITRVGTTVTTINGVPHALFVTPNTAIAPLAQGNHTASGTWSDGAGRSAQVTSFPFDVSATPGNLGVAVKGRLIK